MYSNVLVKNDMLNDMNCEIGLPGYIARYVIYCEKVKLYILYKSVVEYRIIYYFNLITIMKIIESKYTIFNNMSNYTILHDLTI